MTSKITKKEETYAKMSAVLTGAMNLLGLERSSSLEECGQVVVSRISANRAKSRMLTKSSSGV